MRNARAKGVRRLPHLETWKSACGHALENTFAEAASRKSAERPNPAVREQRRSELTEAERLGAEGNAPQLAPSPRQPPAHRRSSGRDPVRTAVAVVRRLSIRAAFAFVPWSPMRWRRREPSGAELHPGSGSASMPADHGVQLNATARW